MKSFAKCFAVTAVLVLCAAAVKAETISMVTMMPQPVISLVNLEVKQGNNTTLNNVKFVQKDSNPNILKVTVDQKDGNLPEADKRVYIKTVVAGDIKFPSSGSTVEIKNTVTKNSNAVGTPVIDANADGAVVVMDKTVTTSTTAPSLAHLKLTA
ncbi:hypothetical protein Dip510_001799 [Elusimicrobium posterum]|uniref:hypothetical protein n=1 Tax=Elusimicrobium posterum TaxID=3116653 RepID=UPI003C71DC00